MYKLIALDIDGTLINQSLQLTAASTRAIHAAQRQGIHVTLATGRSFHSARKYARELGIDIPFICANGGVIRHLDGTVLQQTSFTPETAYGVVKAMEKAGTRIHVFHNDGISCTGRGFGFWSWLNVIFAEKSFRNLIYAVREYRRSHICNEPDLVERIGRGEILTHKIFSSGTIKNLTRLNEEFSNMDVALEFYPGYNGNMYLEIMPGGVNKGAALAVLAQHLNVPMEQTIAVGDNLNDLTMVATAGLGVAMGNGHADLKEIADYVTYSNDEDGVAAVIRDFILAPDKFSPATRPRAGA